MSDTPTQTIADALLLLSLGRDNKIGKDAASRLTQLERENAALREALDAQMKYHKELRADRDRFDFLEKNGHLLRATIDAAIGLKI